MKTFRNIILFLAAAVTLFLVSCGADEDVEFSHGTLSNNVYSSELAGFRFEPGPAWDFLSEEELLEKNGIDVSLKDDEEALGAAYSELDTVYDMEASNANLSERVNINFEKINSDLIGNSYSADDYADRLEEEIKNSFSDYGVTFEKRENVELIGKKYVKLVAAVNVGEGKTVQRYLVRKTDGYMMSLCITADEKTDVEEDIMPLFSELDQ